MSDPIPENHLALWEALDCYLNAKRAALGIHGNFKLVDQTARELRLALADRRFEAKTRDPLTGERNRIPPQHWQDEFSELYLLKRKLDWSPLGNFAPHFNRTAFVNKSEFMEWMSTAVYRIGQRANRADTSVSDDCVNSHVPISYDEMQTRKHVTLFHAANWIISWGRLCTSEELAEKSDEANHEIFAWLASLDHSEKQVPVDGRIVGSSHTQVLPAGIWENMCLAGTFEEEEASDDDPRYIEINEHNRSDHYSGIIELKRDGEWQTWHSMRIPTKAILERWPAQGEHASLSVESEQQQPKMSRKFAMVDQAIDALTVDGGFGDDLTAKERVFRIQEWVHANLNDKVSERTIYNARRALKK